MYKLFLGLFLVLNHFFPGSNLVATFNHQIDNYHYRTVIATTTPPTSSWDIKIFPDPTKEGINNFLPSSSASLAMDENTGLVIAANNKDARLPIASLTKLMTAYVILKEQNLNNIITVQTLDTRVGDSLAGLSTGEKLTVLSVLKGLLINSGSDAALTLAINSSGSEQSFVVKMNQAAADLGLKNTKYANPVGWDDVNNYSSASDLASLTRVLLLNKTFRDIVQTKNTTIYTTAGIPIPLVSTNILLGNGIVGVKTGNTNEAGECLIALYQSSNHQILTIILGSNDRFGQTLDYLGWINSSFLW